MVSAFPAAFPGESQFSCSEQEVHSRASQLTRSLRGLVFDSSLPATPVCEQAQHWQKLWSRPAPLNFTMVPMILLFIQSLLSSLDMVVSQQCSGWLCQTN